MPLLVAGTEMPLGGEAKSDLVHLYCADPTDGVAKFPIATPTALSAHPQASERRTSLGIVTIKVDKNAPPLHERLELEVLLDDDLILSITASSSQKLDRASASYFDLEFGLGLPTTKSGGSSAGPKAPRHVKGAAASGLVVRANVSKSQDQDAVPGDVLYLHKPSAFARHIKGGATEAQVLERLYYEPCAVCRRQWGDPECRCGTA
jgi:hypothetical protein